MRIVVARSSGRVPSVADRRREGVGVRRGGMAAAGCPLNHRIIKCFVIQNKEMARPTDDKKESTVILRLNDDLRGYIEGGAKDAGVSMSEYVRRLITGGYRNHDLEDMLSFAHMTMDGAVEWLYDRLSDGEIEVNSDGLRVHEEYNLSELREVCEREGLDVQDVINMAAYGITHKNKR